MSKRRPPNAGGMTILPILHLITCMSFWADRKLLLPRLVVLIMRAAQALTEQETARCSNIRNHRRCTPQTRQDTCSLNSSTSGNLARPDVTSLSTNCLPCQRANKRDCPKFAVMSLVRIGASRPASHLGRLCGLVQLTASSSGSRPLSEDSHNQPVL